MQELIEAINRWSEQGNDIAIATVTETWGSSPRGVGSQMVVNSDGEMVGSVSGGCVEGAVVEGCLETMQTGVPQHLEFGVADESAWEIGLSCGGRIKIFVRLLNVEIFELWKKIWRQERKFLIATIVNDLGESKGSELIILENGEIIAGSDCDDNLKHPLSEARAIALGKSQLVRTKSGTEIFLNYISPPQTLIIVGGVHIAISLVSFAKKLGFRTIVIDPRKAFANQIRFNHADKIYADWPSAVLSELKISESTAVAVLSHDPKIDDPVLEIALRSSAFYVGALGSRKTQVSREKRLLEAGLKKEQVGRLHAPIGLNLGGHTPEQISLAIMAEIVQASNQ